MKSNAKVLIPVVAIIVLVLEICPLRVGAQNKKSKETQATQQTNPAQSAVKLQPLNIKTGLWESTTSTTTAGQMPVPAEMLNRLTPEQRAKMEARMKANSAAHSRSTTHQNCVTSEDLEKYKSDFADGDKCSSTIVSSTSTSAKAKMTCDTEGMHGTGTYEVEAADPEHVNGTWHATMTGNGQTMNVDGTFTSKWLTSNCRKTK